MKITAWRIVQAKYLQSAFDGEGAGRFPGRWNHRGTPMVYTAGSLSLAAMEMLVNIEAEQVLNAYMSVPVTFDEELCKRINPQQLPADWASYPISPATRDLGTSWAQSKTSAVLAVRGAAASPLVQQSSAVFLNSAWVAASHLGWRGRGATLRQP